MNTLYEYCRLQSCLIWRVFTESMKSSWSTQKWVKLKAGWGWLTSSWAPLFLIQMEQRYGTEDELERDNERSFSQCHVYLGKPQCPIINVESLIWNSVCMQEKCSFFVFADRWALQHTVAAPVFIRLPLQHKLYRETKGEGGWWVHV